MTARRISLGRSVVGSNVLDVIGLIVPMGDGRTTTLVDAGVIPPGSRLQVAARISASTSWACFSSGPWMGVMESGTRGLPGWKLAPHRELDWMLG